ncbi:hypothetical protein BU24DRAFT_491285 [Aaosphaeria arxii CBS 175.79]|uniref:PNPLA domain-containing protein n=1 Tax=Aaosphaeria arxii CBS 175.79 TaxID=1450172 RepID=A0A6A5Y018_9PLEO|nr:uncharacterized protein BU24DRAFT_491285 [Aaosphaeria arxii CBS 175.79]KAF2018301.1 hypothetical protein BU24DRAFT_491285 [Aaosphaeria arxii CBS 175.79]
MDQSQSQSQSQCRPLRVLCLDGGGIRGLSELLVLKRLMYCIRPGSSGQPLVKPCDYFDIICGTSTGGILAVALGRLRMDIDECITFFCDLMKELFQEPEAVKLRNFYPQNFIKGSCRAWFTSQTLVSKVKVLIETQLGPDQVDAQFEQLDEGCKVFVCATRAANRGSAIFRSYPSNREPPLPCTIWEVVAATMAMPPFFDPVTIGGLGAVFADGAVKNNNPIWVAVEEVRKEYPEDAIACLVSLGAGKLRTQGLGSSMRDLHRACVDIARDTEEAARLFLSEYKPLAEQGRYFRFNVEQGLQDVGVNEFPSSVVDLIDAATADYLGMQQDDLNRCIEMLKLPTIPSRRPNVEGRHASNRDLLMWIDAIDEYETLWQLWAPDEDSSEYSESDFVRNSSLRFPGTCDWIKTHEDVSVWLSSPETQHCFLHGIPGSGKTVLAAFVGKWLRQVRSNVPTLVFFCDSKNERKSAADSFFRNAIVQLLYYKPHLSHLLTVEMGKTGKKKVLSWAHLKSIFLQLLHEFEKVYIVVDAVDEMNTLGQDVLSETFSKLSASLSGSTTVATFMTSRTRADVLAKLSFCHHNVVLQRDPFDNDLQIFVSLSVDRSEELQALFEGNSTFIRELKETLLARSEGMFLLPKLLLQELKSKETMEQMRQVLTDIPQSLSEYYTQFMDRIEPSRKNFAMRVFSWLACTLRPLSLDELQIGLQSETQILKPEARYELANIKYSIEKACSCLVVLHKGQVQLAHSSIKRYLLKPQTQDDGSNHESFNFDIATVHEGIALVSLKYLLSPDFSMPLSGEARFSTNNIDNLKTEYPFLLYASQNWHTHVGMSPRKSFHLLTTLSEFLGSVNCRSYIELVFSYWTFPNVTLEDVSNILISWVSKEPDCEEEAFIFNWGRDLWDINLEMSGLFQEYPSEIHFLRDLLPSTAVYDEDRVQRSFLIIPQSFYAVHGAGEAVVHESADASGQSVAPKSDRFLLTESAMIDWESTISTPHRYLQNIGIRWEVNVQNLQTQKRYARHSLSLCRREGICCSVAVAPNDQHCAVSWPEYQDDDATEPLKIKTYAWSLRWDESRSPVWRKWEWTDRAYGCDYTRAAGFKRTKNSIAFTADSEILATPGGFYNVTTGNLAYAPPLFTDTTVSGLTFSSNAEYAWGSKGGQHLIVYRRDSEQILEANKEPYTFCEVIGVAPDGKSAIALLQRREDSDKVAFLALVTSRSNRFQIDEIHSFEQQGKVPELHEQWQYIRGYYASGGQIHISSSGKVVLGLPVSHVSQYTALMFNIQSHRSPTHTSLHRATLKTPKDSKILSVRYQRGTEELYGLTDQSVVWRFTSEASNKATNTPIVWEAQPQSDDRKLRNFFISDYSVAEKNMIVALQLGTTRPKFGSASLHKEPIEFSFQISPVTRLLELIQSLQRTVVTVELGALTRCYRQNTSINSLRLLGLGQTSTRKLENFIPLSDQLVRDIADKKLGDKTTLQFYSHFTANEDGSLVACPSVYVSEEGTGPKDDRRMVYGHISLKCLNSGNLANFNHRLGSLSNDERIIHHDFIVRFDEKRQLMAFEVHIITTAGLEERRVRYDINHIIALSTAFRSSARSRSPSPVVGLFNAPKKREALALPSIAELDPAMEMTFCSEKERLYYLERPTGVLVSVSTCEGHVGTFNWSIQIFGEWPVFEAHHMTISNNILKVLGLTYEYMLCLVELDLQKFEGRRRYVSSMWGSNMGDRATVFAEPIDTPDKVGLNIIVCRNQQTDVSKKLDPEQTEAKFKPAVIFVPERAMGPWVQMAWEPPEDST